VHKVQVCYCDDDLKVLAATYCLLEEEKLIATPHRSDQDKLNNNNKKTSELTIPIIKKRKKFNITQSQKHCIHIC